MQVLLSVIDDGDHTPTPEQEEAVDVFNRRLQADGQWVFAGGLGSTDPAWTLDDRDGAGLVTDGPFIESKEYLAGFWILEVPDIETALALGAEGSRACHRKIEVRPFL